MKNLEKNQFFIYGYHPPMKGEYIHDIVSKTRYDNNKTYYDNKYQVVYDAELNKYKLYDVIRESDGKTVKDFRTVERFKEELDCGLNVMFLQGNAVSYSGEDFESSEMKGVLDSVYKAGYDKAIICDNRLHALSSSATEIIGENARFKSFDQLVEFCKDCMKPYMNHPAFFGVYLHDEPTWNILPQLCQVFRALKVANKGMFVQTNLLPMSGDANAVCGQGTTSARLYVDVSKPENKNLTVFDAYVKYLEYYAQNTGADNITMDSYPIRQAGLYEDLGKYDEPDFYKNGNSPKLECSYYIMPLHFATLQTLAETCKKYDVALGGVSNSCAMIKVRDDNDNILLHCYKTPDEADMRYQTNAYMAFGGKIYSYYTYWAKRDNAPGCYHLENTTFIGQDGTKLPLYFIMKKIHAEMQDYAKILCDFNYQSSTWLGDENIKYLQKVKKGNLLRVKDVRLNFGESVIVTELKNSNDEYIYAIFNASTPLFSGENAKISVDVEFNGSVKSINSVCGRELVKLSATDNKLNVQLNYGDVKFIYVK